MGGPKQYRYIAGQPMLWHALQAFSTCQQIQRVQLVLAPDDTQFARLEQALPERVAISYCGGESRHASVLAGLTALTAAGAATHDWVMVHDAARPGITPKLIQRLIAAVLAGGKTAAGGILALPVADTLKRASDDAGAARIVATEPRERLWLAQTPQMFPLGRLRDALEQALASGATVTDEASAIERLGGVPLLVQGSPRNFKVTYPDDFALAEAILGLPA